MGSSRIVSVLELLEQGKSLEAIDLSTKLVNEMPSHVTSHVALAMALESQERYRDALRAWQMAGEILPNSPLIRKGLVRVSNKMVRAADGEFQFADWTADEPNVRLRQPAYMRDTHPEVDSELLTDPLVTDTQAGAEVAPEAESEPSAPSGFLHAATAVAANEIDTALLPGFESTETDFDVEPEFEERVTEDMSRAPDPIPGLDTSGPGDDVGDVVEHPTEVVESESETDAPTVDAIDEPTQAVDDTGDPETAKANIELEASDELDQLISDLETAKIVPADKPVPSPDLKSNTEGVVSETLARIFATQKQYAEASKIYERLAYLHPERESEFREKAAEMMERTQS